MIVVCTNDRETSGRRGAGVVVSRLLAGRFLGQPGEGGVTVDATREAIELHLRAEPAGKDTYRLTLSAHAAESGEELGQVVRPGVAAARLMGNLALVSNFQGPRQGGEPRPILVRRLDGRP